MQLTKIPSYNTIQPRASVSRACVSAYVTNHKSVYFGSSVADLNGAEAKELAERLAPQLYDVFDAVEGPGRENHYGKTHYSKLKSAKTIRRMLLDNPEQELSDAVKGFVYAMAREHIFNKDDSYHFAHIIASTNNVVSRTAREKLLKDYREPNGKQWGLYQHLRMPIRNDSIHGIPYGVFYIPLSQPNEMLVIYGKAGIKPFGNSFAKVNESLGKLVSALGRRQPAFSPVINREK